MPNRPQITPASVNRWAWQFVQGFAFIALAPIFGVQVAILCGWQS